MEIMVTRDIAEFEFGIWAHTPREVSSGSEASFCLSCASSFLVTKEARLHLLLHFGDLQVFLAQFMLELCLFVL